MDLNALKPALQKKGIHTANKLQNALISHPHHIATVSGDAIMMPQDNFLARIAFVDYDGARALDMYQESTPKTREDRLQFVQNAAPRMVNGIEALRRFVEKLDG